MWVILGKPFKILKKIPWRVWSCLLFCFRILDWYFGAFSLQRNVLEEKDEGDSFQAFSRTVQNLRVKGK